MEVKRIKLHSDLKDSGYHIHKHWQFKRHLYACTKIFGKRHALESTVIFICVQYRWELCGIIWRMPQSESKVYQLFYSINAKSYTCLCLTRNYMNIHTYIHIYIYTYIYTRIYTHLHMIILPWVIPYSLRRQFYMKRDNMDFCQTTI